MEFILSQFPFPGCGFHSPRPRLPPAFPKIQGKLRVTECRLPSRDASPAEGWCLYSPTTPWLRSAKSCAWIKSKEKKSPPAWPCVEVGNAAGDAVPHPTPSQGIQPAPPNPAAPSLRCWDRQTSPPPLPQDEGTRDFPLRFTGERSRDAGGWHTECFPSRWLMPRT